MRGDDNVCAPVNNPPIYFDTSKTHLPNPVVQLPALGNGLEVIDSHKDSNGQEFILVNGLNDSSCSQFPDKKMENTPVFGQLPDGTWVQFDQRLDLKENSLEAPLSNGGGILPILANNVTMCANVARSPFNEHTCKLSTEPSPCTGTSIMGAGRGVLGEYQSVLLGTLRRFISCNYLTTLLSIFRMFQFVGRQTK